MITREQVDEIVRQVQAEPYNGTIHVLVPLIKETTSGGIIKGDEMLEDEKKNLKPFLRVLKVAAEILDIQTFDEVYCEGPVTIFSEDVRPAEFEIDKEDYQLGIVPHHYIKSIIRH